MEKGVGAVITSTKMVTNLKDNGKTTKNITEVTNFIKAIISKANSKEINRVSV